MSELARNSHTQNLGCNLFAPSLFAGAVVCYLLSGIFFSEGPALPISLSLLVLALLFLLWQPPQSRRQLFLVMLALLALGLIPRAAYVVAIDEVPFSDMADYDTMGRNFLAGHFERGHHPFFRSFYMPGMGYVVAVVYKLFGEGNLTAFRWCSVGLGTFCILLCYFAGVAYSGLRAGLVASFLFALSHEMVFWMAKLSTEHLFGCVSVLAFLCTLKSLKLLHRRWAFLAGFCLGCLFLIRPVLYLLLMMLVFAYSVQQIPKTRKLLLLAFFACGFFLPLAPWLMRNVAIYGTLMISTTGGWFTALHQANDFVVPGSLEGGHLQTQAQDEAQRRFSNDLEASNWAKHTVLTWIASHPGKYLALSLGRVRMFFLYHGISLSRVDAYQLEYSPGTHYLLFHWRFGEVPLTMKLTLAALCLVALAWVLHIRHDTVDKQILFLLPTIYFAAISLFYILVMVLPRYRDTVVPLSYLLVASGVHSLGIIANQKFRDRTTLFGFRIYRPSR